MRSYRQIVVTVFLFAGVGLTQPAHAQDIVKYGVIGQFTGPFAVTGEQYKQGLEAFVAQNGATAGGRKIELVYRDTGGPNPAQAKRLAEELLVRDKVTILGGLYLSPEAAAAAPAVNETKTPTLLFNAASPSLMPASRLFRAHGPEHRGSRAARRRMVPRPRQISRLYRGRRLHAGS